MTRTTTFHNNQSTSVPISVIIVDINERNSRYGTGGGGGDRGAICGSIETLIDRWLAVHVVLELV